MLDFRMDRQLKETFALDVPPALGTFGLREARILAPGDPSRSVLFFRMAKLGHGRMPHVGSTVVDEEGLALIGRWIEGLGPARTLDASDVPGLLGSASGALDLVRAIDNGLLTAEARRDAIRQAMANPKDEVRGLFERYVPADQRPKRLGTRVNAAEILALKGEAERGRLLFFESTSLQCRACHMIAGRGESFGPDLSHAAAKSDRKKILESILEPSKEIDPKYVSYVVQTTQGAVYTGLLVEKTADVVVLRDAQKNEIRLRAASVEKMVAQKTSIMPEFLLQGLTAAEAADLLEFLASLR